MSCFMVSDKQITVMIQWAEKKTHRIDKHEGMSFRTFDQTGNVVYIPTALAADILRNANARAMIARYGEKVRAEVSTPYQYRPLDYWTIENFTPVQILAACNSFDYQACEADEWANTFDPARFIFEYIKDTAIRELPGYEEAAYTID